MSDTVQELFTETSVEMSRSVPTELSVDVRERYIAHVVADLASKILRMPGTNPRGLTITVTSDVPSLHNPIPQMVVVATAPMHER